MWSTPDPYHTFGQQIYDEVKDIDPEAVIWDTRSKGRPDMVALAEKVYRESGAEAVFCISNRSLTRKIVRGLKALDVPAYGPIWDS